jgi:hypothetical protein
MTIRPSGRRSRELTRIVIRREVGVGFASWRWTLSAKLAGFPHHGPSQRQDEDLKANALSV